MGEFDVNQMKQALIRQGIPKYRVDFMSDAQVQKLCNERLHESLTGNQNWNTNDQFMKELSYDSEYTLPGGEKIKVASVTTQTLRSGNTVQVFVDYAGNQYFSYKDSKGKTIDENTFNVQEKMQWGDKLNYQDGILYTKNLVGVLKPVQLPVQKKKTVGTSASITPQQTPGSKYHPKYKDLEIDKNGKIDKSQFTLAKIKSKYGNPAEYRIVNTQLPDGEGRHIYVVSKNDKMVYSAAITNDGRYDCVVLHNDGTTYSYYVNEKGIVDGYSIRQQNGSLLSYNYEPDGKTLESVLKDDGKGKRRTDLYEKNAHTATINIKYNPTSKELISKQYIQYRNGKPYYEEDVINKTGKFYAVTQLCDIVNNKNFSRYNPANITKIINIIDSIEDSDKPRVLEQFRNDTGYPLTKIFDFIAIDDKTKLEILSKFYFEGDAGVEFVNMLNADCKKTSDNNLANHLSYLNKDNVMKILPYIQNLDVGWLLTDKGKMDQVINRLTQILDSIKDDKQYGYTKDCVSDLIRLLKSPIPNKREVAKFSQRLVNRIEGGNRAYVHNLAPDKDIPNGKLDKNFKQSTTGDCWLLAGLISIQNNEKALEKVNALLTVSSGAGNEIVNLKGVGKKFLIRKAELNVSTHLSQGEADTRAIEIAVDKYIKKYDPNFSDINGNNATYLWKLLFGNENVKTYDSFQNYAANKDNSNKIFALGLNEGFNPKDLVIEKMDGTRVPTIAKHEYSIIGSDSIYIYLKNPHDSSEPLRSPINQYASAFDKNKGRIHIYEASI